MNKKTAIAFGAFVVLCAIAVIALRQPEKGERASDRARPIPAFKTADITTLEVTKNGVTTTIANEGGTYKVTAPLSYPADSAAAKSAFEALGKMDISDLVTQQQGKQTEFEVDDKSGVRVVAKHGTKVLADLIVGKSVGAGAMVRPHGTKDIWRASGLSKYTFDKSTSDWRDKDIVNFAVGDAEKIDVTSKDGAKISVKKTDAKQGSKQGGEDKWEVVQSSVKIDKLDNSIPNGIVSALSSWKGSGFADGIALAAAGLDTPALTVTVGLKGGKSVTALIGNKKGDDEFYVKKSDAPQVFLIKKYALERVDKRPIEFRDKTLCDLAADDIAEISVNAGDKSYTLVKDGKDWKATKPAKLEVDGSKVTPIAGAFKDLKGTAFAEDQSLKDNGLSKPRVITIKGKAKGSAPACVLRVGDETKDKVSYFVATTKNPEVFLAPKWTFDRVLVKPDDLKKAGTSASASKPTHKKLAAKG